MRQTLTLPSLDSTPSYPHSGNRMHRYRDREPVGYQMRPNFRKILNQLIHFENSILVVRSSGLSCSRKTSFGHFGAASQGRNASHFTDQTSGLTIDLDEVENVFLIDWITSAPSLEISLKHDGFAISIELGQSACSEFIVEHLIENHAAARVDPEELWLAGAGAWLDEWEHVRSLGVLHRDLPGRFTASFEGSGFQFRISGETLTDFPESNIHRISARDERTFIFAHDSVVLNTSPNRPHLTHARN